MHLSLPGTLARTRDFESLVANRAKRHRSREHCDFEPVRSSTSAQGRYFSKHHTRLVPFVLKLPSDSSTHRGAEGEIPFGVRIFVSPFLFFGQIHFQSSLLGAASIPTCSRRLPLPRAVNHGFIRPHQQLYRSSRRALSILGQIAS